MKRLLLILVILVLSIILLAGCSGNGVTPPFSNDVPPLTLIREYVGGQDFIVRWPDGVVSVCDITGETKEIWDEINKIIDGPVIFKLTDDITAQIGIEYQPVSGLFFVGFPEMSNYAFEKCGILINPTTASGDIFTGAVLVALGIHPDKWTDGLTEEMKTVIYWLYKLEPGYSLL